MTSRRRFDGTFVAVRPRTAHVLRRELDVWHKAARDNGAHPEIVEDLAALAELARDVQAGRVIFDSDVSHVVSGERSQVDGSVTVAVMTTDDVAGALERSPQEVRRLVRTGALPSWKTERGHRRYLRSDVDELLEQRRAS